MADHKPLLPEAEIDRGENAAGNNWLSIGNLALPPQPGSQPPSYRERDPSVRGNIMNFTWPSVDDTEPHGAYAMADIYDDAASRHVGFSDRDRYDDEDEVPPMTRIPRVKSNQSLSPPDEEAYSSYMRSRGGRRLSSSLQGGSREAYDLSLCDQLDERFILQSLKRRFQDGMIYTHIGEVLISMNPYSRLPIYDQRHHTRYRNVPSRHNELPHIFFIADKAFQQMQDRQTDQVILVSGESGAGKTEATKYMIEHITFISHSEVGDLHDRILKANPVLEAFGNASTVSNDNSSRFGKFVELSFTPDGVVVGAQIIDYLLEKSRVVQQGTHERNFHIFYYLFAGMPEDRLKYYYLENPYNHRIIAANCEKKDIFENKKHYFAKQFRELEATLRRLGFTDDDLSTVWMCLAAILFITNIDIATSSGDEDDPSEEVFIDDLNPVGIAADLLQVNHEALLESILSNVSSIGGSFDAGEDRVVVMRTVEQARDCRDAIAKGLYSRLFGWIVLMINKNLQPGDVRSLAHSVTIGILDLSGFENFRCNSLEQLLINCANEHLQFHFNKHIFVDEQEQYKREGISLDYISFPDNEKILNLFTDKPIGMFSLLDEESRFPKGSDVTLVQKWTEKFSKHPNYKPDPRDELNFTIVHYAGKVIYDATNFLEKNKDNFSQNLRDCLSKSSHPFISDLFQASLSDSGGISRTRSDIRRGSTKGGMGARQKVISDKTTTMRDTVKLLRQRSRGALIPKTGLKKNQPTTASYFTNSLQEMMKKMKAADPHFVRCIKPNDHQMADKFVDEPVREQLRYNGVLEIAKIRQMGFPVRMAFRDFVERYRMAVHPMESNIIGSPQACRNIMDAVDVKEEEEYLLGKRKIFMKDYVTEMLKFKVDTRAVIIFQKVGRGHLARLRVKKMKEAKFRKIKKVPSLDKPPLKLAMSVNMGNVVAPKTPVALNAMTSHPLAAKSVKSVEVQTVEDDFPSESDTDPDIPPDEEQAQEEDAEEESDEEDMHQKEPWDIANVVPKETPTPHEDFQGILKFLKFSMYILLLFTVWVTSTISQLCLLLLTRALNIYQKTEMKDNEKNMRPDYQVVVTQLLCIMCFPKIFAFVSSLFKALFSNTPWPSVAVFIAVVVVEALASVGEVLLVFQVMPYYGSLMSYGIMFSMAFFPSLLKLCFSHYKKYMGTGTKALRIFVDSIVFLVQAAGLGYPLVLKVVFEVNGKPTDSATPDTMAGSKLDKFNGELENLYWQVPLGVALMSLRWWENFCNENRGFFKLKNVRQEINITRHKMTIITSAWGILVTIATVYAMGHHIEAVDVHVTEADSIELVKNFAPGALQIVFTFACFYFSTLACKLLMQRVSFCVALYLSIPTVVTIITLQCRKDVPFFPLGGYEWWCDDVKEHWLYLVIALAWVVSLLWTAGHVWFCQQEKLAKTERLFVNPFYVGPFILPSMLLNRRIMDLRGRTFDDPMGQDAQSSYNQSTENLTELGSVDTEYRDAEEGPITMIYACATMWHETREEMIQLLKSLFRMDMDQAARRKAQERWNFRDPNYYEFEPHIFFDDAMAQDDDERWIVNDLVKLLCDVINEACSAVLEGEIDLGPPTKVPTPYGGKLIWKMPGGNDLVVHLKDKQKIRHKKRWSQVMYMYFLLGYKLFGGGVGSFFNFVQDEESFNNQSSYHGNNWLQRRTKQKSIKAKEKKGEYDRRQQFEDMRELMLEKAENTYILALDGDVDFKPEAVRILVDRMKKNMKVGAACGRIHPIGTGPVVWYQKFEYAIGHWFQKATEHVFGCVLCSPGCFSLFRGSALMDDNVMKRYSTVPTSPSHYLQYDQGEDRWLCTLLLQQGYKVDYAAASDALTFAPEGFDEFFNQRRRWVTSTLANQLDVLNDYKNTIRTNDNISYIYIVYQFIITVSTFIGPATIVMAIASAFKQVLGVSLGWAMIMSILPVGFYIAICFLTKPKTQVLVAGILSAFYAGVMMVVLVGIIESLVTESIVNPSLLFIVLISGCFILGGILHPYEFWCLAHGVLYYLLIPSGYLILIIYSFGNMNSVSWGTREVPKKKTKKEQEEEEKKKKEEAEKKKNKKGFFSFLRIDSVFKEMKDMMMQMFQSRESPVASEQIRLMQEMNTNLKKMRRVLKGKDDDDDDEPFKPREVIPTPRRRMRRPVEAPEPVEEPQEKVEEEDPDYPYWAKELDTHMDIEDIGPYQFTGNLNLDEMQFWIKFIKKYEKPFKADKQKQAELTSGLLKMKNDTNFALWFINGLWILFNYMILESDDIPEIPLGAGYSVEPLGFVFLVIFFLVMILQLIGMFMHRWGTFLQLMSITELPNPLRNRADVQNKSYEEIIQFAKDMGKARAQYFEPAPDYDNGVANGDVATPGDVDVEIMRRTMRDTIRTRPSLPWYQSDERHTPHRPRMDNVEESHHRPRYEPPVHHHEAVSRAIWNQITKRERRERHHRENRERPRPRSDAPPDSASTSSGYHGSVRQRRRRRRGENEPEARHDHRRRHRHGHRSGERNRSRDRSRDRHRNRSRDRSRDRHRHRDRSRDRDRDRSRHKTRKHYQQFDFDRMFDYRYGKFVANEFHPHRA